MELDIQVPAMGESISEGTISQWLKGEGDAVSSGETVVEIETDKVMVEVPAPEDGVLTSILVKEGDTVTVGQTLAKLDTEAKAAAGGAKAPAAEKPAQAAEQPAPAAQEQPAQAAASGGGNGSGATAQAPAGGGGQPLPPAARRMVAEHGLDSSTIQGTGVRGQITKGDVVRHMEQGGGQAQAPASGGATMPPPAAAASRKPGEREERVKMTRLRQRIAERLVQAQQTAAMLTTFNEVDMSAAMALRSKYKDAFREKYGVALGFMSFFTKACIDALRAFPAVNAEIDGDEIIYKNFYDIGVAVGTERGLVVPVVRNADQLRFIEVELAIGALAAKARDGKLTVDDLSGGTFTISNGGVYGSMLSTPILNPPQSGILGMHNIVQRPMAVGSQVEVRPMMFVALSYDHRIIDGREAVQFLVKVKECIEDPARMMLEI